MVLVGRSEPPVCANWSLSPGPADFIAVGHGGTIVTSKNGVNWTRGGSRALAAFEAVVASAALVVAVGSWGHILTSPVNRLPQARRLSLRQIFSAVATTLELIGEPSPAYALQASTDLKTWTTATVSPPGVATRRIVLPLEKNFNARFYRAVILP
jgi:hypothetical protein